LIVHSYSLTSNQIKTLKPNQKKKKQSKIQVFPQNILKLSNTPKPPNQKNPIPTFSKSSKIHPE
jgi:hypothetical protein